MGGAGGLRRVSLTDHCDRALMQVPRPHIKCITFAAKDLCKQEGIDMLQLVFVRILLFSCAGACSVYVLYCTFRFIYFF